MFIFALYFTFDKTVKVHCIFVTHYVQYICDSVFAIAYRQIK